MCVSDVGVCRGHEERGERGGAAGVFTVSKVFFFFLCGLCVSATVGSTCVSDTTPPHPPPFFFFSLPAESEGLG